MTDHLTEDEMLTAVPMLTRNRLVAFVQTELVIPLRRENQGVAVYAFRQVDLARVQLLCDLTYDLELDETALGIVITLIDKLHTTRQELFALARAVEAEKPDIRARIGAAVVDNQR